MKDTVTKYERVSFKNLGIKSPAMQGINPKYWGMKKAQQERWSKEDKK